MKLLTATLSALLLGALASSFQDAKPAVAEVKKVEKDASALIIAEQLPSYPITECVISGEPLDAMGEPIDMVHEGRLVRLCCKGCVKGFKKNPADALAKIDEGVKAAQLASYPLETCAVSGEKLGSMGDPIDMVHGTRLVRLCCKGCVKGFKKESGKYMAEIDKALIAAQLDTYPLDTCLISGETIEGEGENVLYGTRLVRFCCGMCAKKFKAEPAQYVAKLDESSKKGAKASQAK